MIDWTNESPHRKIHAMYADRLRTALQVKSGFFFILAVLSILTFSVGMVSYLHHLLGLTWTIVLTAIPVASTFVLAFLPVLLGLLGEKIYVEGYGATRVDSSNSRRVLPEHAAHIPDLISEMCHRIGVNTPDIYYATKKDKDTTIGVLQLSKNPSLVLGKAVLDNRDFVHRAFPQIAAHELAHIHRSTHSNRVIALIGRIFTIEMGFILIIAAPITSGWRVGLAVLIVQNVWGYLNRFLFARSEQVEETLCDLYAAQVFSPEDVQEALIIHASSPAILPKFEKMIQKKWRTRLFGTHPYFLDRIKNIKSWENKIEGERYVPSISSPLPSAENVVSSLMRYIVTATTFRFGQR